MDDIPTLRRILKENYVIAMVGLSANWYRPSFFAAKYMLEHVLSIGRALMGNPSLLLLDEPLEGLAPIIVAALLSALQRLIRDESFTVILVEQSAKLALEVTQQALALNRGRIVYHGASEALLDDPVRLTGLIVAQ